MTLRHLNCNPSQFAASQISIYTQQNFWKQYLLDEILSGKDKNYSKNSFLLANSCSFSTWKRLELQQELRLAPCWFHRILPKAHQIPTKFYTLGKPLAARVSASSFPGIHCWEWSWGNWAVPKIRTLNISWRMLLWIVVCFRMESEGSECRMDQVTEDWRAVHVL